MIYNYSMAFQYTDSREKVFVDMDGVLADFDLAARRALAILNSDPQEAFTREGLKRTPGWYLNLPPIPGAIKGFQKLTEKYNTYILSTPSWSNINSWGEKRIWVAEHLGDKAFKKLILAHDKGLFSGKALIDDRDSTNQPNFDGLHIHFGQEPFEDWDRVLNFLL